MDDTQPPPVKKQKQTPLQKLQPGESMVEVKLKILAADAVRNANQTTVWTIIGTDGYDFVNVTMWGEHNTEKMTRELGPDFLNSTFLLHNFSAAQISDTYNHGSVHYELRAKEGSTVSLSPKSIAKPDHDAYYAFLCIKHEVTAFQPIPMNKLRVGESMIEFECELLKVRDVREVLVGGREARVFDAEIHDGKMKGTISAWNLMCDFLHKLLDGKVGWKLRVQNVTLKRTAPDLSVLFTNSSKVELVENNDDGTCAEKLSDFIGKRGLKKADIRLRIAKAQVKQGPGIDGTMVHDTNHKCQLKFPTRMLFALGEEIMLNTANVEWNGDVLTLTVYEESSFMRLPDKQISGKNFLDLDYPESKN